MRLMWRAAPCRYWPGLRAIELFAVSLTLYQNVG